MGAWGLHDLSHMWGGVHKRCTFSAGPNCAAPAAQHESCICSQSGPGKACGAGAAAGPHLRLQLLDLVLPGSDGRRLHLPLLHLHARPLDDLQRRGEQGHAMLEKAFGCALMRADDGRAPRAGASTLQEGGTCGSCVPVLLTTIL